MKNPIGSFFTNNNMGMGKMPGMGMPGMGMPGMGMPGMGGMFGPMGMEPMVVG